MKKILLAIAAMAVSTAVYATCVTNTTFIGGKTIICTTCCYSGNCTTTCY